MEEIEVPLEKVQEDIHHAATHGGELSGLMTYGALISAILAVFAAVSALYSGHAANEAMLEQIRSSDRWSYYQAKGIKASLAELKLHQMPEMREKVEEKIQEYKKEQEDIRKEAEKLQEESAVHLHKHETLSRAVTFFQVAIALTAISVLARKRRFLLLAMALGLIGLIFLVLGFLI